MPFTPVSFEDLLELLTTQYAAQASLPANTNTGSALGAIFNAVGLLALNIQNELQYVQTISRMLSSSGADLDTWGAQFGLPRLPATPATGTVAFTTQGPLVTQLIIPVGGIVQTQGGLQYAVIAPLSAEDPNFSSYNAVLGGYIIGVGNSSGSATVQCLASGTIGNVAAGTIVLPGSTGTSPLINGVASINNPQPFINGTGAELDVAYQARMVTALSTGTVATPNAIAAAILATQPGLTYSLGDGLAPTNPSTPLTPGPLIPATGNFTAVVNENGTGTAPQLTLLSAINANVQKKRAGGISGWVVSPIVAPIDVIATITVQATSTTSVTQALADIAVLIQQYQNNIGLNPNGGVTISEISQLYVIMRTYPNVTNVTNVAQKLSGSGSFSASDITAAFGTQLVSSGSINLTPGS